MGTGREDRTGQKRSSTWTKGLRALPSSLEHRCLRHLDLGLQPDREPAGGCGRRRGHGLPIAYVQQVQREARAQVFPVLAVSYVLLILLVLMVSRPARAADPASRTPPAGSRMASTTST